MNDLLRYAFLTGNAERILRYLGAPVRPDGQPHPLTKPEVLSRVQAWHDGARIRHWVDNNSVKLYNEQNVVRIEMTINRPDRFKVFRFKEGQQQDKPKQRLPLRKGTADLPLRAKVSADVNQRFMAQLATFTDTAPVAEVFADIGTRTHDGRKVRALDPAGKDQSLLQAIADPALGVSGITNKDLQSALAGTLFLQRERPEKLSLPASAAIFACCVIMVSSAKCPTSAVIS